MRTFYFDLFMSLVALSPKSEVPGVTDDAQYLDVIFSGLSLSGYVISLEGAVLVFLLFLGVYAMLEHSVRLLPQEKFRLATGMARWVHTPLVLLRNRLEEIVEGGVPEETCRMLEPALEYAERIIIGNQNIMQLDKADRKVVSETRITEMEVYRYVRMVVTQCQAYAGSHHVRMEISHSEDHAGCRINEGFMTAALQYLLNGMVDITAPGGCIYITVSHNTRFWKLQATNYKSADRKPLMSALPIYINGSLRIVGKIIRLHGGKVTVCRHGKAAACQIVVPTDCYCKKNMKLSPDIFLSKRIGYKNGEVTDSSKKECTSVAENLPCVLLVMTDSMFGNYLYTALSGEFNILLRETLDMSELASVEEKPDAIVIDENVGGTCGDELCSRIKAEEMTAVIPVILLVEYGDSRSYLSHAGSGADRLELRTSGICQLRADIHMLINSCMLLRKSVNRMLADTVYILPETVEKDEDNLAFISKVRKLIEENMATQGYTIDMLCAEIGMSRTGFYYRMKELTGKFPMEYVLTFKMERAKVLLASGRYSVTEIAEMLGYCDAKYFGKKFKDFYHTSPTKFIKEGQVK